MDNSLEIRDLTKLYPGVLALDRVTTCRITTAVKNMLASGAQYGVNCPRQTKGVEKWDTK